MKVKDHPVWVEFSALFYNEGNTFFEDDSYFYEHYECRGPADLKKIKKSIMIDYLENLVTPSCKKEVKGFCDSWDKVWENSAKVENISDGA